MHGMDPFNRQADGSKTISKTGCAVVFLDETKNYVRLPVSTTVNILLPVFETELYGILLV